MGDTLICTLGLAPAVVTECLQELLCRGVRIGRVVCIYSSGAKPSFKILEYVFKRRFGVIELVGEEFELDDIRSDQDSLAFRRKVAEVIERERSAGREIHLCISGGRKTMGFDALLVAQAMGVRHVYHVVSEEHRGPTLFSALQDQFSVDDLLKRAESEEGVDALLLDICDPRHFRYYVIDIPIPDISVEERERMKQALGI